MIEQITDERKGQLARISQLRGRDILVYASDISKAGAPISIVYADLLPFQDQLSQICTPDIDIILETPGGYAEVVEDMVNLVRSKFQRVGVIIPGSAKSAGTIFAMAGDEILMGEASSLGPIDAQVQSNGKHISADAFIDGLEKIKQEISETGRLHPVYLPMLNNISPGDLQHFENAQNFSRTLVRTWLSKYKFKYWENHSTSGIAVTDEEKKARADDIAKQLCKHSNWLTHGRSIRISNLSEMGLKVHDYMNDIELCDAITRYYTLLRMTFDMTGSHKIIETKGSQIYQSQNPPNPPKPINFDVSCDKCKTISKFQINLGADFPLQNGHSLFPSNGFCFCPKCHARLNLNPVKQDLETKTGLKAVIK